MSNNTKKISWLNLNALPVKLRTASKDELIEWIIKNKNHEAISLSRNTLNLSDENLRAELNLFLYNEMRPPLPEPRKSTFSRDWYHVTDEEARAAIEGRSNA